LWILREERAGLGIPFCPGVEHEKASGGQALDELVKNFDHLGTRMRAICGFRNIQGGLVAGPHEDMRERHHWLRADAPQLDPLRHKGPHQSEDVQLADFPPVRPAQDGRAIDEGDAVNLRLDADVEPRSYGVPQDLDRIGYPGSRRLNR
jgi:hypothetical protein